MSLKEQIEADIKKAMLAKEKDDLRALRAIKSMILLALSEPGASENLSADIEMKILQKAAKQRADSLTLYRDQNRNDLAEIEQAELDVIKRYLPEQLSWEELEGIVSGIIEKTGASSMKDMGKVMGMASKELAGKADGKTISGIVKKLLS
ncbi:MAG: GatB/YqeY domain-containing protein [Cyclobacteriaceae bacterium]|nr:GatB/YqeY domain-containing protein [Cyclobacteriaceae bacterium]